MRAGHCLHTDSAGKQRYCCWCTLVQHVVREKRDPVHGPNYDGERYAWHWEPSSNGACKADALKPATAGGSA